jgi:hypothetical protein
MKWMGTILTLNGLLQWGAMPALHHIVGFDLAGDALPYTHKLILKMIVKILTAPQ